jgi:hypothetical protein
MEEADIVQDPNDLIAILEKIKNWNITSKNVHKGTSKRVYVKGPTNAQPTEPYAYLTSIYQKMEDPETLIEEYKYTRFLHQKFDHLIIPELSIEQENKPLTNILNAGRGLLITKKPIVMNSIDPKQYGEKEITELLEFMMNSTDELIDKGFANLDLKPQNIGLTDKLYINDNGSNMFYPIPEIHKEYYRDAIKLVGLINLTGLTKEIFDTNRDLYPNIDFKRAIELCIVDLDKKEKEKIIDYAQRQMRSVEVDGKSEDLSFLFGSILFPKTLVEHYGTSGSFSLRVFERKLSKMGLVPVSGTEIQEAKEKERVRKENENKKRQKNNQNNRQNNRQTKKTKTNNNK